MPIGESPLSSSVVICSFKYDNAIGVERWRQNPYRLCKNIFFPSMKSCNLIKKIFSAIFENGGYS